MIQRIEAGWVRVDDPLARERRQRPRRPRRKEPKRQGAPPGPDRPAAAGPSIDLMA